MFLVHPLRSRRFFCVPFACPFRPPGCGWSCNTSRPPSSVWSRGALPLLSHDSGAFCCVPLVFSVSLCLSAPGSVGLAVPLGVRLALFGIARFSGTGVAHHVVVALSLVLPASSGEFLALMFLVFPVPFRPSAPFGLAARDGAAKVQQ